MKQRFRIGDKGELIGRDGAVYGQLTSVTLDLPELPPLGDYGESSSSLGEEQTTEQLPPSPKQALAASINLIWAHYVEVMHPRSDEIDPQARGVIRDALAVASEEECLRAIDGCKASPWHMGENPGAKKYKLITQILKGKTNGKTTREQIDMFLDYAESANGPPIGISPGRMKHLKDAIATYVQTGAERERAQRARTTLVEAGVYTSIEFIPAEQRASYVR